MADFQNAIKLSRQTYYTTAMAPRSSGEDRQEKDGITKGGVKKTIWFHEDEAEALRLLAFKERRSESAIVREAVRKLLKIED
jgi:hypothetical protein